MSYDELVTINLRGHKFDTYLSTVNKSPYLSQRLEKAKTTSASGNYDRKPIFINRDHTQFRHILNFLDSGKIAYTLSAHDISELIIEADFYQLTDLVVALKAKLTGPGLGGRSRKATKRRRRRYK